MGGSRSKAKPRNSILIGYIFNANENAGKSLKLCSLVCFYNQEHPLMSNHSTLCSSDIPAMSFGK